MRIDWLDTAKGFAIVGIVLIHAVNWAPTDSTTASWVLDHLVVSLPVLFLVSGIVAGRRIVAREASWRSLWRRVAPLLYLYLLWQPVVFGYRLLGHVITGEDLDLLGELARVAASIVRPNGEIWYLWALALHLALAWATRRWPTVLIVLATATVGLGIVGWGRPLAGEDLWHVLGPGLQGLPQYAFLTVIGARLGPQLVAAVERWASPTVAIVALATWLAAGEAHIRSAGAVQPLLGILQVLVGTAAALLIARVVDAQRAVAPIRTLGSWSVVPYLTHTAVIVAALALAEIAGATPLLASRPTITIAALTVLGTIAGRLAYWPARGTRADALFRLPERLSPR